MADATPADNARDAIAAPCECVREERRPCDKCITQADCALAAVPEGETRTIADLLNDGAVAEEMLRAGHQPMGTKWYIIPLADVNPEAAAYLARLACDSELDREPEPTRYPTMDEALTSDPEGADRG